jgi:hypothetical protein
MLLRNKIEIELYIVLSNTLIKEWKKDRKVLRLH